MLFGKKPAEERSPQELEIALQEAEMPQKGLKPFLRKNGKKLVAVLVVLVLLIALFAPKGKKKAVSAETQYTTVSPENRDITNVYSASGTLSAANAYTVKPLVKGEVLTADFEVGDTVEKGDVLYTIDSSDVISGVEKAALNLNQAQRSYDDAVDAQYIRTDIGGTVASFKVRVGDVVTAGQEVAAIRDDTTLLLSLEFPAADAANFTVGQGAEVLLDSTFEAIGGTVQSVSGADTLSSGNLLVRTVTIAVKNTGNLTAAQAATATINGVSALSSARFSYQREQTVTAQQNGTVSALCVKEGAQVSADTALIQLSGDNLTKQVQNASDSLRSAELSVEDTQKQVDDYTITAPISGTIISKDVKVGDTVGTSASSVETMCVIYDMSYLEMTLNVDELEILSIKEGQEATITADAIPNQTFRGVVTSVSKSGTTTGGTTTYPVTIRIDEMGDLLPGMNATAEIVTESAEDTLSVPNEAIVRGNYVLVTKDSPSAANADDSMTAPEGYVYVKVTTGVSDDDYIAVTSGLQAGDTVAYNSALNVSGSSGEMQFVVDGGDMGGAPAGGGPGGGGPGGGF
ncbi:MAG: HlyD family efflux transporter periplasmic adaptor subunit [Ruminococcaceae bacterium]|nr:HlyD family efflux transporter periplasmic adaptor subunit [Oscillospiraceae bacterium]